MFSEDDLRLLETLANQAAVALENGHLEQSLAELSRLKEQLRYQAYHDPLTGLANRTLFLEQVDGPHRPVRATRCRSSCSSTSTTSRSSTTRSATPPATGCWSPSPSALRDRASRPTTSPRDWAATSSPSCSTTDPGLPRVGGRRRPDHRGAARAVLRRRARDHRRRQHRHRRRAARHRADRRAAAQRRRRDVHGQGRRQEPRRRSSSRRCTPRSSTATRSAPSWRGASATASSRVYYQPIVDARRTREVTGIEALVRWRHPTRGLIGAERVHPSGRGDRHDPRRSAAGCSRRPAARPPPGQRRPTGPAPDDVGEPVRAAAPGTDLRRATSRPSSTRAA